MIIWPYVFYPFILEIALRWYNNILTFNYLAIHFILTLLNIIPFYTTHKYKNIFIWFYFILFYIPNFIDTIHIFLFSGEIDYLSVKAVFNTNIKETTEFFSNFLNLKLIIFILSEIIVSIILLVHSLKSKIYKKFPKLILLFCKSFKRLL